MAKKAVSYLKVLPNKVFGLSRKPWKKLAVLIVSPRNMPNVFAQHVPQITILCNNKDSALYNSIVSWRKF